MRSAKNHLRSGCSAQLGGAAGQDFEDCRARYFNREMIGALSDAAGRPSVSFSQDLVSCMEVDADRIAEIADIYLQKARSISVFVWNRIDR